MRRILSYLISPVYWLYLGFTLGIFHVLQVIAIRIGGYPLRKRVVDLMTFFLIYGQLILGARIKFRGFKNLPTDRPLIIVSNHQAFFDIAPIVWGFRKHHPKFVSKKELGKGIPSVSYNLKHGGSVLIDRKNPRQSILEIARLGKHIEKENYSASIFPEGTRSKTGVVGKFQPAGIASLLKYAPSALIVPLVIDGHDRLIATGYFPLIFGTKLNYTALEPIEPKGQDIKELTADIENQIKEVLSQ